MGAYGNTLATGDAELAANRFRWQILIFLDKYTIRTDLNTDPVMNAEIWID